MRPKHSSVVNDNKKSRKSHQPMNDLLEAVLKLQDASGEPTEAKQQTTWKLWDIPSFLFQIQTTNCWQPTHLHYIWMVQKLQTSALSFAMFCPAENPVAQERLYAETVETLVKNNGQLTYEALNEIFGKRFIWITSLYPPALFLANLCTREYALPSIVHNLPVSISPATAVLIPIHALHL